MAYFSSRFQDFAAVLSSLLGLNLGLLELILALLRLPGASWSSFWASWGLLWLILGLPEPPGAHLGHFDHFRPPGFLGSRRL